MSETKGIGSYKFVIQYPHRSHIVAEDEISDQVSHTETYIAFYLKSILAQSLHNYARTGERYMLVTRYRAERSLYIL